MKLSLPRLRRMPRNLVVIGQEGQRRYFRIGVRWDGGLKLREANAPPRRGKAVLAIDAEVPLRRLFRVPPRLRQTRNLLLATAADGFPFEVDEGLFALSERDGRSYVFALEEGRFEELTEGLGARAAAVLVAPSSAPGDLLSALRAWLRDGPVRDMLGRARPVRPSTVMFVGQTLLLAGLAWFAVDAWLERERVKMAQQEQLLESTRAEAEPLLVKRRSVFRMVEADRALTELHELPSAKLASALGTIVGALPDGSRIDRIRLTGQQLVISGWGEDPAGWLQKDGPVSVKTLEFPKEDKFEISAELAP